MSDDTTAGPDAIAQLLAADHHAAAERVERERTVSPLAIELAAAAILGMADLTPAMRRTFLEHTPPGRSKIVGHVATHIEAVLRGAGLAPPSKREEAERAAALEAAISLPPPRMVVVEKRLDPLPPWFRHGDLPAHAVCAGCGGLGDDFDPCPQCGRRRPR